MIDKRVGSVAEAVTGITDGMTLLVGGFGSSGIPDDLLFGVLELGVRDLTVVTNNAGVGDNGLGSLLREHRVRRIICSYPRSQGSVWFEERYKCKEIELELVPQGTLSERMRAAGAGLGGFFTPTGADSHLAKGKEVRLINGRRHVFEEPLRGDVAVVRGHLGDRWGNLTYWTAARNFNPTMATAADLTIAQVTRIVELGDIDPEVVVTPGIFIDRLVEVAPS